MSSLMDLDARDEDNENEYYNVEEENSFYDDGVSLTDEEPTFEDMHESATDLNRRLEIEEEEAFEQLVNERYNVNSSNKRPRVDWNALEARPQAEPQAEPQADRTAS